MKFEFELSRQNSERGSKISVLLAILDVDLPMSLLMILIGRLFGTAFVLVFPELFGNGAGGFGRSGGFLRFAAAAVEANKRKKLPSNYFLSLLFPPLTINL